MGRISTIVVLLLTCLGGPPARHGLHASSDRGNVVALLDGPTRWLMLPDEERRSRRLKTVREAVAFIEDFWLRRDPDPRAPGNETSKLFYERVEAADELYGDDGGDGVRGSMTDRGRALVLLGSPPTLRYSQKRVPSWRPGPSGSRPLVDTQNLVVETWVYRLSELPAPLAELVTAETGAGQIELSFAVERRGTHLIDGEKYLQLAALALVREP